MKPNFVLGELISEAWTRSRVSYARSIDQYRIRVENGLQPQTPFINLFDVKQQNIFLAFANVTYLTVAMILSVMMKKRATGMRLRWWLVFYDAINVGLAAYIAISTLKYKLGHGGLLLCNPISNDLEGYRIANVFVLFYLQKYFEFIDTWFFILRKSSRQVTFLHLFHHSSITIVVGTILPFDYNGDMYLPILLNSANHMLVYLHYLLASLGQQSWWAPYITSMQLGQFCLIFGQSLLSYRLGPTCGSPDFAKVLMIMYMGSLVALFGHFFLQKYILGKPSSMLDLCGVVKRPSSPPIIESEHSGIIQLNASGCGTVLLPSTFPDPQHLTKVKGSIGGNHDYLDFDIVYQLTAIGSAMPNLHVLKEVARWKTTSVSLAVDSAGADTVVSIPQTAAIRTLTGLGAQTVKSSSGATSISAAAPPTHATPRRRNTTSPAQGSVAVNSNSNASIYHASGPLKSCSDPNMQNRVTSPGNDENQLNGQPDSESFHWWDSVQSTQTAPIKTGRLSGSNKNGSSGLARSSSTGNLPNLASGKTLGGSGMTKTVSAVHLEHAHADRLIDGPIPLLEQFKQLRSMSTKSLLSSASSENLLNPSQDHKAGEASAVSDPTSSPFNCGSNVDANVVAEYQPLCFIVAGGAPSGRVSWTIKAVRLKASFEIAAISLATRDWRSIA